MFNIFKRKNNENKEECVNNDNRTCYQIVKEVCDKFDEECDFTKYEKEAIDKIERRILKQSKEGVREVRYSYETSFPYHADMNKVIKYFKEQGFNVSMLSIYKSDIGGNQFVLNGTIRW